MILINNKYYLESKLKELIERDKPKKYAKCNIDKRSGGLFYECICGYRANQSSNFCPNCGQATR